VHYFAVYKHKGEKQEDGRVQNERRGSAFSTGDQPEGDYANKHSNTGIAEPKMPELKLRGACAALGKPVGVVSFYLTLDGSLSSLDGDFIYEGIFRHTLFWLVSAVKAKGQQVAWKYMQARFQAR
jgi:hypothetical protein